MVILLLLFIISASGISGGYWPAFSLFAIVVGCIANMYVFAVAAFWSAIIMGVIALIAALIALIFICCILLLFFGSDNSNDD